MSVQINIYYECDSCGRIEEFNIPGAEFYYDYMLHPEGVDFFSAKIKWHDNILYSYKGEEYENHEGDYTLLCDKCYNELKEKYDRENKLYKENNHTLDK